MSQYKNTKILKVLDKAEAKLSQARVEGPVGRVVWSKDGIVLASGLKGAGLGEVALVSEYEIPALIMQVEGDSAYCVMLEPSGEIKEGQFVRLTGNTLSVPAGAEVLGRVIDPLGNVLDGGNNYKAEKQMPIEASAPGVMARQPVSEPLETGILAIDALIPIGRGQRELIIGDRQTGKTTIAIDAILNQKDNNVICVYVAVGQRDGKTAQVIRQFIEGGAMKYTVVVAASASSPAALQYLAPYAGAAIAEFFMAQGKHALVVYDDLSKHAVAYREISLLLRKPPGREAYPGDVFYLHSRLLERAVKLKKELGGGSITALPIVETQAGDVSAYIPTNVISITDGQIFLESKLFYKGVRPAINVGISVSRVGGAAQTKIMKKISGSTKLSLAQYYDLAAFSQFASELDAESKKQLQRGQRLVEALKQKPGAPYRLWQECLVLWCAQEGYLDSLPAEGVAEKVTQLLAFAEASYPKLAQIIDQEKTLTDEIASQMKMLAEDFFKQS